MPLTKGFEALALKLQEAAMLHSDVSKRLGDAVNDAHKGTGSYGYYIDHTGDGESGDCIYSSNGDIRKAPYTLGKVGGKPTANIDTENSTNVVPTTSYDEEAEDDDHYTAMGEALKASKLYADLPIYERFISKGERAAADDSSFAGKGSSFPILKPGDVGAAVHAMGRAGSSNYGMAQLKANIIRIAKKKGFGSSLPKAWQSGDDSSEAASLDLIGDVIPLKEGAVGQDGTAYLKLISPGWGSSGYYSKEMLARDGAKAFPKGTKNFWDHATDQEERDRPEGSLRNLASVLTEDAHYESTGPAGSGLYAKAEVQPDFRGSVDSLAKHIGMSIRAQGKAKEGEAEGRKGPLIQELSRGISVDYVTTPGAGGQILQLFEAAGARRTQAQGEQMTDEEKKQLREAQQTAIKATQRLSLLEAAPAIDEYFTTVRVGEAIQKRVKQRILAGTIPLTEAGEIDRAKLKTLVETETKDEVKFIQEASGRQIVIGMGSTEPAELTEAQKTERAAALKQESKGFVSIFDLKTKAGRKIMREGRSAFDPNYNAGDKEGVTSGVQAEG